MSESRKPRVTVEQAIKIFEQARDDKSILGNPVLFGFTAQMLRKLIRLERSISDGK